MKTRKLTEVMQILATRIFRDFIARGGEIRDGEKLMSPELAGSTNGGLPAILWMTKEFIDEYKLGFPELVFVADQYAYTGYALDNIVADRSASPAVLMLSDFLRNEMLIENVVEIDLAPLFANYREWAHSNIIIPNLGTSERTSLDA